MGIVVQPISEDVFILECDTLAWTQNDEIRRLLGAIALVSRTKAIINVASSLTVLKLKTHLQEYNLRHGCHFRRLLDHQGNMLWQDYSPRAPVNLPRTTGTVTLEVGVTLPGTPKKELANRVEIFAIAAKKIMEENGFDFENSSIKVTCKPQARGRGPCSSFAFSSHLLARSFFYLFDDYHWDSDDSCQTIVVKIIHGSYQKETLDPVVRRVLATCKN